MTEPNDLRQERRRRLHRTFIFIILGTLPCYFCGIVLLVGFGGQEGLAPATEITTTATETATLTETPPPTEALTDTPGGPTITLPFTPTQFSTPTTAPTSTPTETPDYDATATIEALLTQGANSLTATAAAPTLFAQATQTQQAIEAAATASVEAALTATANANATATANASATAAANTAPDADSDSTQTQQDQPVTIDVLSNDQDADGDSIEISNFAATSEFGGTVACTTDCTYTPASGYFGTDTFTYTISDGRGGTDQATVTVEVNAQPNAVDDDAATEQNTDVSIQVLTNDADLDGDDLTIIDNDDPSEQDGNVDCSDTRCDYTPPEDFTGEDHFSYTISDGRGGSDDATVTITVTEP